MWRCDGEWGPSSPHRQTLPSPQLVELKMSERPVPITIVRVVIKFLTNENDDEQVENFMRNWLQTRPPSFYNAGLKKPPNPLAKMHRERWKLCRKVRIFLFCKIMF